MLFYNNAIIEKCYNSIFHPRGGAVVLQHNVMSLFLFKVKAVVFEN